MTGRARTVFLKEIRETLRDKRVILSVFVGPVLVFPLVIAAVGFFAAKKAVTEQAEMLEVAIVKAEGVPLMTEALAEMETLTVRELASRDEAERAVTEGGVSAALVIDENAMEALNAGENTTAEILFNNSNDRSRNARGRLWDVLNKFKEKEVARRLAASGLAKEVLNPMEGTQVDLASKEDTGGFVLGLILPYIVIIMASTGGMTTAFDICAGEKERGTMETLLVSPASRHEIVLGKLWAVSAVSIAAAFFAVCGIVVTVQGGIVVAGEFAPEIGVSISFVAVAAMLVVIVPLSLMTSSVLLVVSAFARNQKEAQAYIFPFMVLIMLPAMITNFISQDPSFGYSMIPILNTALVMKQVLVGTFDLAFLTTAIASSALYAALTMRVATAMFEKESVLFRA